MKIAFQVNQLLLY